MAHLSQGSGQIKEYISMGHGATREIMKSCDSDINGHPCDGGIVPKKWKKGDIDPRSVPARKRTSATSSGGQFEGKGATSKEVKIPNRNPNPISSESPLP